MSRRARSFSATTLLFAILALSVPGDAAAQSRPSAYDDLVDLFLAWREFQAPRMVDGIPDYRLPVSLIHWELTGDKSMLEEAIGGR